MKFTVWETGKVDGGAYRIVEFADGSARVEEYRGDKWIPGGASFGEIFDASPVSARFAAELGIPLEDIRVTPPTRPRLPTPAEMDDMSGGAFLEAFRELNEEERARSKPSSPVHTKPTAKDLRDLAVKMAEADARLMLARKAKQVAELDLRRPRLVIDNTKIEPRQA